MLKNWVSGEIKEICTDNVEYLSWIDDSKSQKTTPKAMKPDSPVTAKKTMRDFSLTARQHFDNPFSRKGQFDQDMEEV